MEGITINRLDATFESKAVTTLIATRPALVSGPSNVVIVGMVQLQHEHLRCARVRQLYVVPEEREKGIASKLLDTCAEIAKRSQCESIGLLVNIKNERAQAIYKLKGYVLAYADETDFIMGKRL